MPHEDDDSDLREAFADLRREDGERAPSFRDLLARASPRAGHRTPSRAAWLAAAALLAVMAFGWWAVRRPPPAPPMASLERWTAPTDFLLSTPGREILGTVPRLAERPTLLSSGATDARPRK